MNELINEPALRELQLEAGQRVLEVASGVGQLAALMAQRVQPGGCVIGIERDEQQISRAMINARAEIDSGALELRQGDAYSLPLAGSEWGSFDVVHSRFLLEHVTSPRQVVEQMVQAARPGGRIVLQDDDHDIMRFWPAVPAFEQQFAAYVRSYEANSTDGIIGRKLTSLLHHAGAQPAYCTWLFYGACAGDARFGHYIDNLARVLDSARETMIEHGLSSDEQIDAGLSALDRWRRLPDAALWYAVNYAEGVRV